MAKSSCSSMLLASAALLAILLGCSAQSPADTWKESRATWFEVEQDDLRTANCHMAWEDIKTGRYVGAFPDGQQEFAGSCGQCYEIKCNNNAQFPDGYNQWLDRRGACKSDETVIITIADACPCSYPNNQHSNKRWCCSDNGQNHMDITKGAFDKLADLGKGVIGVYYRPVPCDTKPKPAGSSTGPSSAAPATTTSSGPGSNAPRTTYNYGPTTSSGNSGSASGSTAPKPAAAPKPHAQQSQNWNINQLFSKMFGGSRRLM